MGPRPAQFVVASAGVVALLTSCPAGDGVVVLTASPHGTIESTNPLRVHPQRVDDKS
jgi:hypothetical protein